MKTTAALAFVLMLALAAPSSAGAQCYSSGADAVKAFVDLPTENAVADGGVVLHGWSVNLITGRHPASVQLWRLDRATSQWAQVPAAVYWGPRPDVQAWASSCGAPSPEVALGFGVVPNSPQPPGSYTYLLYITDITPGYPGSINWTTTVERRVVVVQ